MSFQIWWTWNNYYHIYMTILIIIMAACTWSCSGVFEKHFFCFFIFKLIFFFYLWSELQYVNKMFSKILILFYFSFFKKYISIEPLLYLYTHLFLYIFLRWRNLCHYCFSSCIKVNGSWVFWIIKRNLNTIGCHCQVMKFYQISFNTGILKQSCSIYTILIFKFFFQGWISFFWHHEC